MRNPTIRELAGATAPKALNPATTALLVIDFQNEYFDGKMPIPDGAAALSNANRLIAMADEAGMPVYQVQHVTPAGSPIFAQDGKTVAFHADAHVKPHHTVVQKSSVSVFPTTDIDARMKASGVDTLIVSGLMTHACVSGAARDAVPLGYNVIVAGDACATRDLKRPGAETIAHHALHQASLTTMADTFADVLSTDEILALPRD